MSFLSPAFLWAGIGISALVVAVHLIVTRQPRSQPFPTARFVPEAPVEAVSRATQPADLLLLLLRVLAVLSIAAALARPIVTPSRFSIARIVLADISSASGNAAELRDSVATYLRPNDVLILYDSATRVSAHADSLPLTTSQADGNLSAALITALQSARTLRDRADSIALVVVSALPRQEWDAATDTIRALWPGSIKPVLLHPPGSVSSSAAAVSSDFESQDPLRYTFALAAARPRSHALRIVRGDSTPGQTDDGVVLHWPALARPRFAAPANASSQNGIVVDNRVVFGNFRRQWIFPQDSLRGASVIATWIDGSPAAIERRDGNRCTRSVAIQVPARGDLVIRSEFVAAVQHLSSPCGAHPDFTPLPDSLPTRLKGGNAAAPRNAFPAHSSQRSPLTPWLLGFALLLLVTEQAARVRRTTAARAAEQSIRLAA